jgi:hypothetical protein
VRAFQRLASHFSSQVKAVLIWVHKNRQGGRLEDIDKTLEDVKYH